MEESAQFVDGKNLHWHKLVSARHFFFFPIGLNLVAMYDFPNIRSRVSGFRFLLAMLDTPVAI